MANTACLHHPNTAARADLHDPTYQAFQILHWGFVAAPVIAGADKFFGLLTNWDAYLSPTFAALSPLSTHATMMTVGVVDRKSTRLNSSHLRLSRMPSSA